MKLIIERPPVYRQFQSAAKQLYYASTKATRVREEFKTYMVSKSGQDLFREALGL